LTLPVFSQAVKSGGFVFVSGQGPFDPVSGDVVGESIQEQTRQRLRNVEAILTAAGSSLDKVVSATFILDEESDFAGMNEEWGKWFPADSPQGHEDFHCCDRRSLSATVITHSRYRAGQIALVGALNAGLWLTR
jgi:enamine deaminase RidA (YjgF/YER057c/UK114 family)